MTIEDVKLLSPAELRDALLIVRLHSSPTQHIKHEGLSALTEQLRKRYNCLTLFLSGGVDMAPLKDAELRAEVEAALAVRSASAQEVSK